MKKSITLLLVLLSFVCHSQDFDYLPAKVVNNQILTYSQFTLSYNNKHEQADWVAYDLTKEEALDSIDKKCNCFAIDKNVNLGSAAKDDYTSTGFDRGHLCPSACNKMSDDVNRESFLMSNISPQIPSFNQGIWRSLESWVRDRAIEYNVVYVVSGPVFVNTLGTISEKEITIPGYFYKVLLKSDGEKYTGIGFLLPHIGAIDSINNYAVPINTIETLTGLDFFSKLDDSKEGVDESVLSLKKWGL